MDGDKWTNHHIQVVGSRMAKVQHSKQAIYEPTFNKMENVDYASTQKLREVFYKVERRYPGFIQDFSAGLLQRLEMDQEVNIAEMCLRIAGLQEGDTAYKGSGSKRDLIHEVETKALALKTVLGTLPDEIADRRSFIDAIKSVASAIKHLLQAVSQFYDSLTSGPQKKSLEEQRHTFIMFCRKFSAALKDYFKETDPQVVYDSGHVLVSQTNIMLWAVRELDAS